MDDESAVFYTSLMFPAVPYTFSEDVAMALTHAKLYMNNMRSYVEAGALAQREFEFIVARDIPSGDGAVRAPHDPSADDRAYAIWPGNAEYGFGEQLYVKANGGFAPVPFHYNDLVRQRDPDLAVGASDLDQAWNEVETLMAPIKEIADAWDLQAVPGLEPLLPDIDELEALLCVIVATEWIDAQETIEVQGVEWVAENGQVLYDYTAAQEALLALEYVHLVADHMARPDVDWLRGDDVDQSSIAFDDVTSTFEYVSLWIDGATKTLESCDLLREQASTVDDATEEAELIPGDTIADGTLQRDVLAMIMTYETALGPDCEQPAVTDTELLSADPGDPGELLGETIERWTIDRCGETVTYTITFIQADEGGVNFSVHLDQPEEP